MRQYRLIPQPHWYSSDVLTRTDGFTQTVGFNAPTAVAASLDGRLALVADTESHTIRQIDLTTG